MHHKDGIAAFWVGKQCSALAEAWNTCFGVASGPPKMGLPWPITEAAKLTLQSGTSTVCAAILHF
jgi:hypothetical protein